MVRSLARILLSFAIIGGVQIATPMLSLTSGAAYANNLSSSAEGRLGRAVVAVSHSQTVRLPATFAEIVVAQPEIADVLTVSDRAVYILGKKIGATSVTVFDAKRSLIGILDVEVTPDLNLIQKRIRESVPMARGVRVTNAGEKIVLSGSVGDAPAAARAVAIAAGFTSDPVINAMDVASPQQVLLEVRVVEATRNASRELGVRWDGVGYGSSGYRARSGRLGPNLLVSGEAPFGEIFTNVLRTNNINVDVTIQALEEKGLVRRLANPNLTALSGSSASFLAGGEFPVPVAGTDSGGVTQTRIEFKRFGVMLEFTPVVLGDGMINLRLAPEVSELDFANAVRSANILVPSVIVRRAATEIALKSGQSFAIAGLLSSTNRGDTAQLPWIGSVPVLGALFRSQAYQRQETELVILVTAHLAHAATPKDRLATPNDRTITPNDVDFFANGKFEIQKNYRNYVERGLGVVGPYGHVLPTDRAGGVTVLTTRY